MSNTNSYKVNGEKINKLKQEQNVKLITHLAQNLTTYAGAAEDKVAELASEALGFHITRYNVRSVATPIGLQLSRKQTQRPKMPTKAVILNDIAKLRQELKAGLAYLTEQVKAVSEDLATLEAKIGSEILS